MKPLNEFFRVKYKKLKIKLFKTNSAHVLHFQNNFIPQIIPPTKPAQINVNSVGGFFDNVIASYSQAVAGGNNMAAVGVLGAAASLFDNVTNVTAIKDL